MKERTVKHEQKSMLMYHAIWETRDHSLILEGKAKKELDGLITYCSEDLPPGLEIINHWITLHHVHLILNIPADASVEHVINTFKQVTNIMFESKLSNLVENIYGENTYVWSPGYYVATLGVEAENKLENLKKQWLKGSQEPGSPRIKAVEAQPK